MVIRKLGRSNLEVTPLCLGSNVFGGTIDERTAFAVLDAYVAAGGNFIDTADIYARGETVALQFLRQLIGLRRSTTSNRHRYHWHG